jgi:hypothetical protein
MEITSRRFAVGNRKRFGFELGSAAGLVGGGPIFAVAGFFERFGGTGSESESSSEELELSS